MYWSGDWSGWAWFAMVVSMLAFWALVVFAIWFAVRSSSATPPTQLPRSAEETLRQRYALGELDDELFERRLQALRASSPTRT
jgi:putative membrane protein